jgi:RNA polymerase sigma-70 factor (ECF subfamily)
VDNFVTARLPLPLSKEKTRDIAVAANQRSSSTETSDEALIVRVCDGDKEALASLFRRHARIVRGVAYRVLRDTSEADDLLQDIFLLIHRLCKTYDAAKGPARFWILQMTYRRAISRRRYLTSRHFYTRLDLDDASEKIGDGRNQLAPNDHAIERMIGHEALQKTFFFDGYTFEEIAAKLGQTTGNVSHHYYRGLEKLRRQMQIFDGALQARRAL